MPAKTYRCSLAAVRKRCLKAHLSPWQDTKQLEGILRPAIVEVGPCACPRPQSMGLGWHSSGLSRARAPAWGVEKDKRANGEQVMRGGKKAAKTRNVEGTGTQEKEYLREAGRGRKGGGTPPVPECLDPVAGTRCAKGCRGVRRI